MTRGGRRAGSPGKAYSNRTDLNTIRSPQTGLNTVAAAGVTPPDQPAAGAAAPTQGGAPPVPTGPPPIHPDQVTPLDAPSTMPHVPVTAGLMTGAGPGPEALGLPSPPVQQWNTGRDFVNNLASSPNASPALKTLAASLGLKF